MSVSDKGSRGPGAIVAVAVCAALLAGSVAAASGVADASRGGAPKLLRLDYVDETESGGDRYDLTVRALHARKVDISSRWQKRDRTAQAQRRRAGSDLWVLGRDDAGRKVRKMIRHALRMRQEAHVNVGARNKTGHVRQWVTLDREVCSREPQLGYNWTCVVRF